ncbi:MAG: HEAT repeat domain-containing protein [Gemmataceae bacterium]
MRRLLILPVVLVVLAAGGPAPADDRDTTLDDELRLKAAFQKTDGASLVAFLSARARGDAGADRLAKLIEGLSDRSGAARTRACADLVAVGPPAVPLLRQAARDADNADAAMMARQCLKVLEEEPTGLTSATVRLLAARRPPGTAEALLAYLPHAETDTVLDEVRTALASVAYDKGKPDPAVVQALADEHPLRRAAAVVALCASGNAEPRATLRKLLADPMPSVRLRASLALAQISDAKAVSTLVTLLVDLPLEQAREVENYLTEMAGELGPKVPLGTDERAREKARDAWAKWWLDTEGTGLLDELRKRTLTEGDMSNAQGLIEKLGDDSFEERQKAEDQIKRLGTRIVPLLRHALKHADLEVRNRAQKCLAAIEMDKAAPLSPITARLIALRKPKGAVEAILAYLPSAEDEALVDELQTALNAVAFLDGKPHPALFKAVTDKAAVRRAAAGQALATGPLAEQMPVLRKLLDDPDATVRLKTALALAAAREPEAVPTLIALVRDMPAEGSAMAEDYLIKLARDNGPRELPDGEDHRGKRSDAWAKWWAESKSRVVMVDRFAPRVERSLGYTLLVQANNNMLVEWDKDKKVRWQMTNLLNPWDAQWLPGNRVLVAEYNGQRVTERNLKGDVLWQVAVPSWPMSAERLPNGHTFVVCRNMLLQFDRGGRQVFKLERPHDIMSGRRLPNGQIVVVTSNRQILRLDRSGKEVKSVTVPNVYYNQNEILDNGNVLVPLGWNNALVEYNVDGKEVWRATVPQPMHATRTPVGTTLVSSQNWPYRIYELDKKGTQVADHQTNGAYVFRVRRR